MLEIKKEYDFDDLMNLCWGQAIEILQKIKEEEKEEEFMELLQYEFLAEIPTDNAVNDFIAYEWQFIYNELNIDDD